MQGWSQSAGREVCDRRRFLVVTVVLGSTVGVKPGRDAKTGGTRGTPCQGNGKDSDDILKVGGLPDLHLAPRSDFS